MRKIAETIKLQTPVHLVEGNTSGGFVVSEINVYEPTLGDMLSASVEQKTLGESLPMWSAITGMHADVLRRLTPYDAGQLAAHIEELTAPFVRARMEHLLKRAKEKAEKEAAAAPGSTAGSAQS